MLSTLRTLESRATDLLSKRGGHQPAYSELKHLLFCSHYRAESPPIDHTRPDGRPHRSRGLDKVYGSVDHALPCRAGVVNSSQIASHWQLLLGSWHRCPISPERFTSQPLLLHSCKRCSGHGALIICHTPAIAFWSNTLQSKREGHTDARY